MPARAPGEAAGKGMATDWKREELHMMIPADLGFGGLKGRSSEFCGVLNLWVSC